MHTGRLVLTPKNPFFSPSSVDHILQDLQAIGLIDQPVTPGDRQHFLLGERFMQLVTFMGCSPFIQLEPTQDNQPFCHLIVDEFHAKPVFVRGRNTTPPHCENCRKRISEWKSIIEHWTYEPESYLAACPHCGHQQNPASYNWRESAGIGRFFLFVENIFPHEAIPANELLNTLSNTDPGKTAWSYFYIQD